MGVLLKRYEELIERLYKSDEWLARHNYSDWDEVRVKDFTTFQLRKNLVMQIESIQKTLHNKLDLRHGGYNV